VGCQRTAIAAPIHLDHDLDLDLDHDPDPRCQWHALPFVIFRPPACAPRRGEEVEK